MTGFYVSGFSHVVTWNGTVFLLFITLLLDIPHFLHPSFSYGQSGCSHFLAVVYNAALNIVHRFLCEHAFSLLLDICLGVELLGHLVVSRSVMSLRPRGL